MDEVMKYLQIYLKWWRWWLWVYTADKGESGLNHICEIPILFLAWRTCLSFSLYDTGQSETKSFWFFLGVSDAWPSDGLWLTFMTSLTAHYYKNSSGYVLWCHFLTWHLFKKSVFCSDELSCELWEYFCHLLMQNRIYFCKNVTV